MAGLDIVQVHGDADRCAGVLESAPDPFADPPGAIGRETRSVRGIEPIDGRHQTEIAILDQVSQRRAAVRKALCDAHDETQIRLNHPQLGASDLLSRFEDSSVVSAAALELRYCAARADNLVSQGSLLVGRQRRAACEASKVGV